MDNGMFFAVFNNDGTPTGFYHTSIHGAAIPAYAVKISDDDYHAFAGEPAKWIWTNGNRVPRDIEPPLLTTVQNAALELIDRAAGAARSRYITVADGQEATYMEKARQCENYRADGYPPTPDPVSHSYVIAEKNARGSSYQEAADAILAERDAWAVTGAAIEELRRRTKIAVANATDATAAINSRDAGISALAAL